MTSADSGIPPVAFLENNEHRNYQYTKIHKGYNYTATVVYHISSLKVPLFVKPADNEVDQGSCTHKKETYIYKTVN